MSNSKLTPEQKIERKELMQIMRDSGGEIMQDSENGATAVILSEFPGSRMVRVSFSFMSPDETKFRRKVGEYWALRRMYWDGESVAVPGTFVSEFLMAVGI